MAERVGCSKPKVYKEHDKVFIKKAFLIPDIEIKEDPDMNAGSHFMCVQYNTSSKPAEQDEHLQSKSEYSIAKEESWICKICFKTFYSRNFLKRHIRVIHETSKPLYCRVCKEPFHHKAMLKEHMTLHTDEREKLSIGDKLRGRCKKMSDDWKRYVCAICFKVFNQSNKLRTHLRTHSKEKPFQCLICLQKFKYSSSFTRHKLVHSDLNPYHCDFCNYKTKHKCNLVRHFSIHTGERKFKCVMCSKTFMHSQQLNRHYLHYHNNGSLYKNVEISIFPKIVHSNEEVN